MSALPEPFTLALRESFPEDFATTDPAELATYGRDWTRVFTPNPSLLALPRTTDEVSRLLALCSAHGVAVVPSGGRTGLAAGAVARNGEVVLSLSRMRRMDAVDALGQTVRVQAGAVTAAVHAHCEPSGLTWPVDFASKGSSHVGGNIATNAGGVKVLRYGLTRQWVLGLQVVLASGQVLELNGALEKNNTGIDLRQLFIGSEGILGVVTEATLKLARLPGPQHVLLFALESLEAVLALFRAARRGPFTMSAYEFFTDRCLARVHKHRGLRSPFEQEHPYFALLETETHDAAALESWLEGLFAEGLVQDGVLARNGTEAAALWALRESISESLSGTGLPHKNDIALPLAELQGFCAALEAVFRERYPSWEVCLFGHVGDGNLHLNVMKPDALAREEFFAHTHEADHTLFALVQKHRGSISAEHGVGLLKKDFLSYSRTPEELALMRTLKRALDPLGVLNPGKVFDAA